MESKQRRYQRRMRAACRCTQCGAPARIYFRAGRWRMAHLCEGCRAKVRAARGKG